MRELASEWGREFLAGFEGYLKESASANSESFNSDLLSGYRWRIKEGAPLVTEHALKWIKDWLGHMKPSLIVGFQAEELAQAVLNSDPEAIRTGVTSGIRQHLARVGFRVNEEKTRRYYEWQKKLEQSGVAIAGRPPFEIGDQLWSDFVNTRYRVVRVNHASGGITVVVNEEFRVQVEIVNSALCVRCNRIHASLDAVLFID